MTYNQRDRVELRRGSLGDINRMRSHGKVDLDSHSVWALTPRGLHTSGEMVFGGTGPDTLITSSQVKFPHSVHKNSLQSPRGR